MINHIFGKASYINKKYIIFESNYVGYKVKIINEQNYELNKFIKLYIYKNIKIDTKSTISEELYGFMNPQERNLFADLLTINGIGTITACNILTNNKIEILLDAIGRNDIELLKTQKGINEKNAILMCSTLSPKYKLSKGKNESIPQQINNDLIYALKQLGYSKEDINLALTHCNNNLPLNELITNSIKVIAKEHEHVQ